MFDIRSQTKERIIATNHGQVKQDSDSDDTCDDSSKLREDQETEREEEGTGVQNGSKSLLSELNNDQSTSCSIQCDILNDESPTLNGKITIQRIDSEPLNSTNGKLNVHSILSIMIILID